MFKKIIYLMVMLLPMCAMAQNKEVKGTVLNAQGQPVPGVSVIVQGTFKGTTTANNGSYSLQVPSGKTVLVFSGVGFATQNVPVTDAVNYDVKIVESNTQLDGVIVSASRISERIMETPVTVESINKRQLEINPSADLISGLSRYKGIDVNQSSLLLGSFSTRGFNSSKSERVIQMIDNVDYMDPSLSLYAGNIMGIPEIDIETVDIIHGANSALYGANAFNGVINQISKDPFKYEGLTLAVRGGSRDLIDLNARLAVKLTPKLAFKINATYFKANEFIAENFGARSLGLAPTNNPAGSDLGWDAINRYGDIGVNPNTLSSANTLRAAGFPTVDGQPNSALKTFFAQGFTEKDLLGPNFDAKNVRINPSLHYLITSKIKASYEYRSGNGAAIYQSSNRYSFEKYQANLNKFEVKSDKWSLRVYRNADKPGRIYDLSFWGTGIVAEQRYTAGPNPSATEMAVAGSLAASNPVYSTVFAGTYTNAFLSGRNMGQTVPQALAFAKAQSANVVPFAGPSDPRFATLRTTVRDATTGNFKPRIGPNSYFWDYSGQYELPVKFATVIVGGSYRKYTLRSDGTLFSDGVKSPQNKPVRNSIDNDEVGGYAQIQKGLLKDMLKLSAAARVDNFQNFGTRFSPRISGVLTLGENRQHNIRVNYAQAYRSPAQIDQYITLDIGQLLLLGNIGTGFQALPLNIGALLAANPGSTAKTFEYRISNLKPEKVNTYEIGYKALISPKVFMDISYYRSNYTDFIGTTRFIGREDGTSPSVTPDASNAPTNRNRSRPMQVWINADKAVKTNGAVVSFDFFLAKAFNITTNYTLSKIDGLDNTAPITAVPGLILGFNTPEHKFNFGVNGKITNNLSYSTNLRTVSSYNYFMPFDEGLIKGFTTVDAQLTYKLPKASSTFRLGATNIGDAAAFQSYGAAAIGRIVYAGVIFDSNVFKKK